MDIQDPPETERAWLNALEVESGKGVENLRAMSEKGRALTPEEIVAILNYLHSLDQYWSRYVWTANALSALGRPALSQRLAQVRGDLNQCITTYGDMYRSAVNYRSQWEQMQHEAGLAVTASLAETNAHTQAVFQQMNRLQMLVNEGVPYSQALLLSHLPQ